MNEEVNLWDEIMDDELHKQIYNVGFQKGKLEQKEEDLKVIEKSKAIWINYVDITESPFKKKWKVIFNDLHKQLQKEIGGNEK